MLISNAKQKAHWIGFAIGNHLEGNHDMALQVLGEYEKLHLVRRTGWYSTRGLGVLYLWVAVDKFTTHPPTQDTDHEDAAYEISELLLFKAQIMQEAGRLKVRVLS